MLRFQFQDGTLATGFLRVSLRVGVRDSRRDRSSGSEVERAC